MDKTLDSIYHSDSTKRVWLLLCQGRIFGDVWREFWLSQQDGPLVPCEWDRWCCNTSCSTAPERRPRNPSLTVMWTVARGICSPTKLAPFFITRSQCQQRGCENEECFPGESTEPWGTQPLWRGVSEFYICLYLNLRLVFALEPPCGYMFLDHSDRDLGVTLGGAEILI